MLPDAVFVVEQETVKAGNFKAEERSINSNRSLTEQTQSADGDEGVTRYKTLYKNSAAEMLANELVKVDNNEQVIDKNTAILNLGVFQIIK